MSCEHPPAEPLREPVVGCAKKSDFQLEFQPAKRRALVHVEKAEEEDKPLKQVAAPAAPQAQPQTAAPARMGQHIDITV